MSDGYRTILADPPWEYDDGFAFKRSNGQIDNVPLPYPSMTLDEIAALPVSELAHPGGAWLWLWTTNRYLPGALGLVETWGFSYRQTLVWWKPDAQPIGGTVAPIRAEFLLLARKGKPPSLGRLPSSVFPHYRTGHRHSQKPEAFQAMIETVSPGPYLEMFARRKLKRWDSWGNEIESDVSIGEAA